MNPPGDTDLTATPLPLRASAPAAATTLAGRPLDVIFVEGLVGQTIIGIYSEELHQTQPVVIDVHAGVPRARACDTDQIGDTIHYGLVRERLVRLLAEHRLKLLEAFAEAIADILLDEFGAHWVRVKVVKPKKFDDVDAVGVLIERHAADRAERAPRPGQPAATVLQLIGAGMVPGRPA